MFARLIWVNAKRKKNNEVSDRSCAKQTNKKYVSEILRQASQETNKTTSPANLPGSDQLRPRYQIDRGKYTAVDGGATLGCSPACGPRRRVSRTEPTTLCAATWQNSRARPRHGSLVGAWRPRRGAPGPVSRRCLAGRRCICIG